MRTFLFLVAALPGIVIATGAAATPRPLNLVLILTDNHSPWTLGCYGNPEIRTPNIDRLASEGMLFERCYSSNAVCSPTRATLLTGLIPSQHGVHCYLRAGGAQVGPNAYSTIAEFRTLPKILAEAGYVCGSQRQVAPGRQSQAAGRIHVLDHQAAREHGRVLRSGGDRRRPHPQRADVPDRLMDATRGAASSNSIKQGRSFSIWLTTGRMAWAAACSTRPATGMRSTTRDWRCAPSHARRRTRGYSIIVSTSTIPFRCGVTRRRSAVSTTASGKCWPRSSG